MCSNEKENNTKEIKHSYQPSVVKKQTDNEPAPPKGGSGSSKNS